jgi:hypothetical protein
MVAIKRRDGFGDALCAISQIERLQNVNRYVIFPLSNTAQMITQKHLSVNPLKDTGRIHLTKVSML